MVVYNRIIRPIFLKHEGDVSKVLTSATDKLGELAGGGEYNIFFCTYEHQQNFDTL
jgi:hypothetical protein